MITSTWRTPRAARRGCWATTGARPPPPSSCRACTGTVQYSTVQYSTVQSSLHRGDRPKLILRNLRAAGCFAAGEAVPTPHMLYNKISHLKRTMNIKYKRNYLL